MAHKPAFQTKRPPLTHFLCIPLISATSRPQLERSFQTFRQRTSFDGLETLGYNSKDTRDQSLSDGLRKIDFRAFRPIGSLHLTLGVMSLNQTQIDDATKFLTSLDLNQLLKNAEHATTDESLTVLASELPSTKSVPPLVVDLKGLEPMHEPDATSVLYIPPLDKTGRLYNFCSALQKLFQKDGYLIEEHRDLRLHATVVNTVYSKDKKRSIKDKAQAGHRQSPNSGASMRKLDARDIITEFRDYVWAEDVTLDRIAICEMGAKKQYDPQGTVVDEVYSEVASVQLPHEDTG